MRIRHPTSGGKAGKGLNKTSTVQVLDENNCIVKQFRFTVSDHESHRKAVAKAIKFAKGKNNVKPDAR